MPMRISALGRSNLLRLPPGEDLLVGLYRICRERGVSFGVFMATGSVRSATLGHLDQECGETCRQDLAADQELVVVEHMLLIVMQRMYQLEDILCHQLTMDLLLYQKLLEYVVVCVQHILYLWL